MAVLRWLDDELQVRSATGEADGMPRDLWENVRECLRSQVRVREAAATATSALYSDGGRRAECR